MNSSCWILDQIDILIEVHEEEFEESVIKNILIKIFANVVWSKSGRCVIFPEIYHPPALDYSFLLILYLIKFVINWNKSDFFIVSRNKVNCVKSSCFGYSLEHPSPHIVLKFLQNTPCLTKSIWLFCLMGNSKRGRGNQFSV